MKRKLEISELIFKIIAYTFLGIFSICCLYPFVYAISASISGKQAVDYNQVILLPKDIQFQAFAKMFGNNMFWNSYTNTLFLTIFGTIWALLPPVVAIGLALITKEVYSSLFVGILVGGLLYSNFNPIATVDTIVSDGLIAKLADSWNVGILLFLVMLGILVALINKAGGSAAFGRWAEKNVKE